MDRTWNQPLPRGRHHLTRAEVTASQRRRILLALLEEVAERGYAATSVAHITARAGVSRKSFYEQFSDKEDCYFAAFDMAGAAQAMTVKRAIEDAGRPANRAEYFRLILQAFLDAVAASPAAARTLLVEVYAVGPEAVRRKSGHHQEAIAAFLAPLGFAGPDGGLTFEGRAVTGAIASLMTHLVAEDRIDEVPGLCDPFVEWVQRHLDCLPGPGAEHPEPETAIGAEGGRA